MGNRRVACRRSQPASRPCQPPRILQPPVVEDRLRLSSAIRLSEFFELHVLKLRMRRAEPRTIAGYRTLIKHWTTITGDPALGAVDEWIVADFIDALGRLPGRKGNKSLSNNTIITHGQRLRKLLELAGPKSETNRKPLTKKGLFGTDAEGIVNFAPDFDLPAVEFHEVADVYEIDEMNALIDGCEGITVPDVLGIEPWAWWCSLFVYIYNVGLRIASMLANRYSLHHTDDAGHMYVSLASENLKGRRGNKFYVNSQAQDAIESIRTEGRDLIWPWPYSRRRLDRVRRQILVNSGLPDKRWFGFHALRRSMCTQLAELNLAVAQTQAGHRAMSTTVDYYIGQTKIVAETMERIPRLKQPRRRKRKQDPSQQVLFED